MSKKMEALSSSEHYMPYVIKHRLPRLKNSSYKILCVYLYRCKGNDDFIKKTLCGIYKPFSITDIQVTYAFGERVAFILFKNFVDATDALFTCKNIVLCGKSTVVISICESFRVILWAKNDLVSGYSENEASLPFDEVHSEHKTNQLDKAEIMTAGGGYATPIPACNFESQSYSENMNWLEYQFYIQGIPIEEYKYTSRTLYVGNLKGSIKKYELWDVFKKFGIIQSIRIMEPVKANRCPYAFIEYKHLEASCQAKRQLSHLCFGEQECKIGYARTMPTSKLWIGGLGPWVSVPLLCEKFQIFGAIKNIEYVVGQHSAYITYESVDSANKALITMRGDSFGQTKHYLRIDFAISPSKTFSKTKLTSDSCFHTRSHITHIKSVCEPNLVPTHYRDIFEPFEMNIKSSGKDHINLGNCKKKQRKRQLSPVVNLNHLR